MLVGRSSIRPEAPSSPDLPMVPDREIRLFRDGELAKTGSVEGGDIESGNASVRNVVHIRREAVSGKERGPSLAAVRGREEDIRC